jgi:hypothetical protein
LNELDHRYRAARTLKQRLRALSNDLGGNDLSYQQRSLVLRCIHLERLLEKKESALAHGGMVDEQSYFSGVTVLSSLFSKLGLKRQAKVVGTLAERYARREDAEAP